MEYFIGVTGDFQISKMEEEKIDKKSQSDQPETPQKEVQNNSPKNDSSLKDGEPENSIVIRDDNFVDTIKFDVEDFLLMNNQSDTDTEDQGPNHLLL